MMMMNILLALTLILLLLFIDSIDSNKKSPPMSYERRRQFDEQFRRLTRQCEQKDICEQVSSMIDKNSNQVEKENRQIEMVNCVRRCISSICYRKLYEKDPLERGEIDVRSNQFKTCWIHQQK